MRIKIVFIVFMSTMLSFFVVSKYATLKSLFLKSEVRTKNSFASRAVLKSDVFARSHSIELGEGPTIDKEIVENGNEDDFVPAKKTKLTKTTLSEIKIDEKAKKKRIAEKRKRKKELLKRLLAKLEEAELEMMEKDALAEAIERYAEMVDYPTNLIPLGQNDHDPLASNDPGDSFSSPQPPVGSGGNGNGNGEEPLKNSYSLVGSKNQNYYTIAEDEIEFNLSFLKRGEKFPAKIKADVFNQKKQFLTALSYVESRDATSNYNYSASLILPEISSENLVGNYFIKVQASPSNIKNGQTIYFFDSFALQYRQVKYKNKIIERLTADGDLEFEVRYQIYLAGNYIFQATLYDLNDNPVAFVEEPLTLDVGRYMLPIKFHGISFYNNRLSGPFILKHLALKYVKANLSTVSTGVDYPNYQTREYRWDQFNSEPVENEVLMNKLQNIESFLQTISTSK